MGLNSPYFFSLCLTSANPPYLGGSGMSVKLSECVKSIYQDSKSDLFAVFIEKCGMMTKQNGLQSMITMHGWMFLSGFEKLRNKIKHYDKITMIHLGARGFEEISGEVVQTVAFVIRKGNIANYKASYVRLVDGMSQREKQDMFISGAKRYYVKESNFDSIPGHRISYWIDGDKIFGHSVIEDTFVSGGRNKTHNNELYVRNWWEIG
ncbi:MAG: Eco57I restriction-modification methylase domain-containing protein, partial [Butyricicoccaceae bacterium]